MNSLQPVKLLLVSGKLVTLKRENDEANTALILLKGARWDSVVAMSFRELASLMGGRTKSYPFSRHVSLQIAENLACEVPVLSTSHSKMTGTPPAPTPGLGLSSRGPQGPNPGLWSNGKADLAVT